MSINTFQRSAFANSAEFMAQVSGIVVEQALYKNDIWTQEGRLDDNTRAQLGQVARQPNSYGFHTTIVNDNTWTLGYDAWATDPPGATADIQGRVQKYWLMLTGIKEPVAPPPPE